MRQRVPTSAPMTRVCLAVLPLALLLCALGAALFWSANAAALPEDLMTSISDHGAQLHSGKLLLKTQISFLVDHRSGEKAGMTEAREEELTFDGVRSRYQRTTFRPTPRPGQPSQESALVVFDGEKVTRTESPTDGVNPATTTQVPRNLPEELPGLVSGPSGLLGHTLRAQLTQSPSLGTELGTVYQAKETGADNLAGLACLRLTAPSEDRGSYQLTRSWWFAPEKGYALAQYQEEVTWTPPVKSISRRQVYTVEEWMQVDSIWLPKVSLFSTFGQPVDGVEQLYRTERTALVSAAVNIPIGDDVFSTATP